MLNEVPTKRLRDKVLNGKDITGQDSLSLIEKTPIHSLFEAASTIREHFRGKGVDLCSIVNAKSGGCSEDCAYCAQSARYRTDIKTYPLMDKDAILDRAKEAKLSGVKRFCIVTCGKKPSAKEIEDIASVVEGIRCIGLLPCATLGLLDEEELTILKESGLERYHHNLETSENYFKNICTTHSYEDKIKTVKAVKKVGLSLCSGGIFGMGEAWQDRIKMALTLKNLDVDSVPLNFLIPIKGTPMENLPHLHPLEALKIISLYRFILPSKEIRICGGRLETLGEFNSMVFLAGADGLLIGHYLTQKGRSPEVDLRLIKAFGLQYQ